MSVTDRARQLATADLRWPDPHNWEKLTFGEQHRYVLRAIEEIGSPLIPADLTKEERAFVDRKTAEAVGWVMRHRDLIAECRAEYGPPVSRERG